MPTTTEQQSNDTTSTPLDGTQAVQLTRGQVLIRELRYGESLEAARIARPLLDDLSELVSGGDPISADDIDALNARHSDIWLHLIAISTSLTPEQVADLPEADGAALSLAFWDVNRGFFMRRLVLGASVDLAPGTVSPDKEAHDGDA
ncbi:MAG TPA: DUF6631 family protein [Thiohalobacter sp.]|nr:DUF6631 family protein [Thiohalobacter sp.]